MRQDPMSSSYNHSACSGNGCPQCAEVMVQTQQAGLLQGGLISGGFRHDLVAAGGSKNDAGKARMDLLDSGWVEGVAQALRYGAKKYAPNNWRKGLKHSQTLGAALRHIFAYMGGEDTDTESGLPHLYLASCELMFACAMSKRPEMDDRYKP